MISARWVLAALALSFCLSCGGAAPPTRSDRPAAPRGSFAHTAEERARAVLDELERYCAGREGECAAYFQPDVDPDAELPEAVRRFVTSQAQEVESLGFTFRWDPRANRVRLEAGTALSYRGDTDP